MTRNRLAVLGLLREHPRHGYQIDQEIKKRSMDKWANIAIASVYNTLTAYEKKGLVTVKKEKVGNMPERKVYHITSKGIKELAALVEDGLIKIVPHSNVVFLLSVGFITNIPPKKALEALIKRKEQLEAHLAMVNEIYHLHKKFVPFNWFYIIDSCLKRIQTAVNETQYLISKVKTIKAWETVLKQH
ncbi:MAG: PadR family transcriptional regulator [Elusimicrobia bacterium]|nr:PadR family transcriptional regulator [Elusimicrobiota bacterium]